MGNTNVRPYVLAFFRDALFPWGTQVSGIQVLVCPPPLWARRRPGWKNGARAGKKCNFGAGKSAAPGWNIKKASAGKFHGPLAGKTQFGLENQELCWKNTICWKTNSTTASHFA